MESHTIVILGMLIFLLLGYLISLIGIRRLSEKSHFANDFLEDLGRYFESHGSNEEVYESLILRSNKMQNALGSQGVYGSYRPPAANYVMHNVPVVLNFLPQLHTYFADEWLSGRPIAFQTYASIRDAILLHMGSLEEAISLESSKLKNPFEQFRVGVEVVLLAPLDLLRSFGVISLSRSRKVHQSAITKFFAGIVSLLTLASSILTIILGWPAVVKLLE